METPSPTATPRITPTPPVPPAKLAAYDTHVPLRADRISLAAVKPLADDPITFRGWSPNGEQFLFGRTEQRYILVQFKNGAAANGFWQDLWVADADGERPRKLTELASDAVWSPDSQQVVYGPRTNTPGSMYTSLIYQVPFHVQNTSA